MSDEVKKARRKLLFPVLPQLIPDHPGRLLMDGRLFIDGGHPGVLLAGNRVDLSPKENIGGGWTEPAFDGGHPGGPLFSQEYVLDEAVAVKRIRLGKDANGNHYLMLEDE